MGLGLHIEHIRSNLELLKSWLVHRPQLHEAIVDRSHKNHNHIFKSRCILKDTLLTLNKSNHEFIKPNF